MSTDLAGDETMKHLINLQINPESNLQGTAYASLEYGIFLNGIGSDGHETLALAPPNPITVDKYHSFCKTARKPYDIVVCAVLCRAKMLMGDGFEFSSDGIWNFDKEWLQARDFYCQVFPDDALEFTTERMGMVDWSNEEIRENESEHGPGFDERWTGAMFAKEILGPVSAILNAQMRGEGITEEQWKWLNSPLAPLNPNKLPEEDVMIGDNRVEKGM